MADLFVDLPLNIKKCELRVKQLEAQLVAYEVRKLEIQKELNSILDGEKSMKVQIKEQQDKADELKKQLTGGSKHE